MNVLLGGSQLLFWHHTLSDPLLHPPSKLSKWRGLRGLGERVELELGADQPADPVARVRDEREQPDRQAALGVEGREAHTDAELVEHLLADR